MNAPTLGSWWVRGISILGVLVACSLAPRDASARDLQGRLGLGYNAQFANSFVSGRVPGISLKYAATRDIAFEAVVGSSTSSPSTRPVPPGVGMTAGAGRVRSEDAVTAGGPRRPRRATRSAGRRRQ